MQIEHLSATHQIFPVGKKSRLPHTSAKHFRSSQPSSWITMRKLQRLPKHASVPDVANRIFSLSPLAPALAAASGLITQSSAAQRVGPVSSAMLPSMATATFANAAPKAASKLISADRISSRDPDAVIL